jgi:hypothetical protein
MWDGTFGWSFIFNSFRQTSWYSSTHIESHLGHLRTILFALLVWPSPSHLKLHLLYAQDHFVATHTPIRPLLAICPDSFVPTHITNIHLPSAWSRSCLYSLPEVEFEVLTVVTMKSTLCRDVMPCSPIEIHRHFGGTCS